jgi:hypothetical protein
VQIIKMTSSSILMMMMMMTVKMRMLLSFQTPFQVFEQAKCLAKILISNQKNNLYFNSAKKKLMRRLTSYANRLINTKFK